MSVGTIDFFHINLYRFRWPWPWLGITRSAQSRTCCIIFLHTFQAVRIIFGLVFKEFKLNILILFFKESREILIIIIALKGAIQDLYNLLTAPRTVSNTYAQVARAQSCANHVQHIERLSCATLCFTDSIQNFKQWHAFRCLSTNLGQIWCDDR